MANAEHLAKLKEGTAIWNQWREDHPDVVPNLQEVILHGANLRLVDLHQSNLSGARLSRVDLIGAKLEGANLRLAEIRQSDLSEAALSRANLRRVNLRAVNLTGADLIWADLTGGTLAGAKLAESNLGEANLVETDLSEADLRRAYLSGANLAGANLRAANLRAANLASAKLYGADLHRADLRGADLRGAVLFATSFLDVDLRSVKGLESVKHEGPSYIGIDTIYRSNGQIPEAFLRGAGVPDSFITFMRSLTANPIEFYSCFISYSTKDQQFADRLYADLQAKGVRCWFARHDIAGGKKTHEQIDEAIRLHEKLLLILSPASMASEWVKTEIAKARKRELKEPKRRMLFPVRLVDFESLRDWECFDADTGNDSAREIREYFIPDFSQWKDHDSYQRAFTRLLRDLQTPQEQQLPS